MDYLPNEILYKIISYPGISFDDVVNCSTVFPRFQEICADNYWEGLLQRTYPLYTENSKITPTEESGLKDIAELLSQVEKEIVQKLLPASISFVSKFDSDPFSWCDVPGEACKFYNEYFINGYVGTTVGACRTDRFLMDVLYNILHRDDESNNLSLKYFAAKFFNYLYLKVFAGKLKLKNVESGFNYLEAAYYLNQLICPTEYVSEYRINSCLNQIYEVLNDIFTDSYLSSKILKRKSNIHNLLTLSFEKEDCIFIMKEVHNYVAHHSNFTRSDPKCIYNGCGFCIEKLLENKIGDSRMLLTLEVIILQHYGIRSEIHDDGGIWRIVCLVEEDKIWMSECPKCSLVALSDSSSPSTDCFTRKIISYMVQKTQFAIEDEFNHLEVKPILCDLKDEATYSIPNWHFSNPWIDVDHWKMERLYYYAQILASLSQRYASSGKYLHLQILLKCNLFKAYNEVVDILFLDIFDINHRRIVSSMCISINQVNQRDNVMMDALKADVKAEDALDFRNFNEVNKHLKIKFTKLVQKRRCNIPGKTVKFVVGQVVQMDNRHPSRIFSNCFSNICSKSNNESSANKRIFGRCTKSDTPAWEYGVVCAWFLDWNDYERSSLNRLSTRPNPDFDRNQPYYAILLNGGSCAFVPEESLQLAESFRRPIKHPHIGKYFRAYLCPNYLPTAIKSYRYPEDANARELAHLPYGN